MYILYNVFFFEFQFEVKISCSFFYLNTMLDETKPNSNKL